MWGDCGVSLDIRRHGLVGGKLDAVSTGTISIGCRLEGFAGAVLQHDMFDGLSTQ
jgi:hypothetical protein